MEGAPCTGPRHWLRTTIERRRSTLASLRMIDALKKLICAFFSASCASSDLELKGQHPQLWGGRRRAPEATACFRAAQAAL